MTAVPPPVALFSHSYAEAGAKFIAAAGTCGWSLESHPIHARDVTSPPLTIDVATSPPTETERRTLVVTSGLHGVEGYFGSAVQLAILQAHQRGELPLPPEVRIVLVHSVNPFGFAHDRRVNEDNVDLNRNFLLPGEDYEGTPAGYESLSDLLHPAKLPRFDVFKLQLLWKALTVGLRKLKSVVATGQHEFPQGLFFGGKAACQETEMVRRLARHWLPPQTRAAIWLDLHSGLGPFGEHCLLTTEPEESLARNPLTRFFDAKKIVQLDDSGIAYRARGTMDEWISRHQTAQHFLAIGVEFGTYHPVRVLGALRAENCCHRDTTCSAEVRSASKAEMREVFCPASERWRRKVVTDSLTLVRQSLEALRSVA